MISARASFAAMWSRIYNQIRSLFLFTTSLKLTLYSQLDGDFTDSDEDDSDESEPSEHEEQTPAVEEDPLGSGDDIDDGNDSETFETGNTIKL